MLLIAALRENKKEKWDSRILHLRFIVIVLVWLPSLKVTLSTYWPAAKPLVEKLKWNCPDSPRSALSPLPLEVEVASMKVPTFPSVTLAYCSLAVAEAEFAIWNFTGMVLPALYVSPSLSGGRNPLDATFC